MALSTTLSRVLLIHGDNGIYYAGEGTLTQDSITSNNRTMLRMMTGERGLRGLTWAQALNLCYPDIPRVCKV